MEAARVFTVEKVAGCLCSLFPVIGAKGLEILVVGKLSLQYAFLLKCQVRLIKAVYHSLDVPAVYF